MRSRYDRRSFLASLGACGAMLPLLDVRQSLAAGPARYPKRIIFFVKGNGQVLDAFLPQGQGDDLTKMTLPQVTKSLEPFKDRMIFMKGVDLTYWFTGNPYGRDGIAHVNWGSVLTGTYPVLGQYGPAAASPSLDNYIAGALAAKMASDKQPALPIKNLVTSLLSAGIGANQNVSWSDKQTPVRPELDPYQVFARLFMGRTLNTGGVPDPAYEKVLAERRSILDYLGRDLESFSKRLGVEDRGKVLAHLQTIRDREREISTLTTAPTGCSATKLAETVNPKNAADLPKLYKMQTDLLVDAMRCDLTRVASLQLAYSEGNNVYFSWLGQGYVSGSKLSNQDGRHYHAITHGVGGLAVSPAARAESTQLKNGCEAWVLEQFAYLLGRLKAVPEGAGTMLDNTVVFLLDTLSDGSAHACHSMPWILAGGCGGYFKTGRYLKYDNVPHNGLYVALANAMDVPPPNQVFGDPKWGNGELAGLHA
jgi:hypothetical protein